MIFLTARLGLLLGNPTGRHPSLPGPAVPRRSRCAAPTLWYVRVLHLFAFLVRHLSIFFCRRCKASLSPRKTLLLASSPSQLLSAILADAPTGAACRK